MSSSKEVERKTIEQLASSGVTVAGLLLFLCELHRGAIMKFDPRATTTAEVVFQAIIPLTARSSSSFAHCLNEGRPCFPEAMVSHAWSNLFVNLVAAVVAYALGEPAYYFIIPYLQTLDRAEKFLSQLSLDLLQKTVWLCIFGVNQHVSICPCHAVKHLNGNPLCQMDKFGVMISFLHERSGASFKQTLALGNHGSALSRAWVVSEIAMCLSLGMTQSVQLPFPVKLGNKKLQSTVEALDVRQCEASRPEDKEDILKGIEDKDAYNKDVKDMLRRSIRKSKKHSLIVILGNLPVAAMWLALSYWVLSQSTNPLIEKILILLPAWVLAPLMFSVQGYSVMYGSIFNRLKAADRLGLCKEVYDEIPPAPAWAFLAAWMYQKVAVVCAGVPDRWRRIGQSLAAVEAGIVLLFACIVMYNSSQPWLWIIGINLFALALCMFHFSHKLYLFRIKPSKLYQCLAVFVPAQLVFSFAVAFSGLYMSRCYESGALQWKMTSLEQAFSLAAIINTFPLIFMGTIHECWTAFASRAPARQKDGHDIDASPDNSLQMQRTVMQRIVQDWAETSLHLRGLPTDVGADMLREISGQPPAALLGVFFALSPAMQLTGRGSITFRCRDDACRAKELLDAAFAAHHGFECERASLSASFAAHAGRSEV